ncbi:MAG TPA: hypothetical protein PLG87_00600 [Treponemataceae bacterium]|jgi:hypothetical protein|nr:hypothetical protein [Treponemataceae bacterium]
MKKLFFLLISACLLLCSSCFLKKQQEPVNLSIFNEIAAGKEWAIITEPYAAFYTEPSKTSPVKSHGRKADILELKGKRIITDPENHVLWYEFDKGWLESNSVMVFSNRIQAENASLKALQ